MPTHPPRARALRSLRPGPSAEAAELEARQLASLLAQALPLDAAGRAAGDAAGEVNQLLVALSRYAGLALEADGASAAVKGHLTEVLRLAESASATTRRLLAVSHRQRAAPTLVRLDELVEGVTRALHRVLGEGITLTVRVAAEDWRVKVDRRQVEVALLHLAAYAREAMPQGGAASLAIEAVTLARDEARGLGLAAGEHVVLTARDSGACIDPRDLARVFDPQAAAATRSDAALGLAACHGIVRRHGGAMTAASAPGEGTTFRVYLPRSLEKSAVSGVAARAGRRA